MASKVVPAKIPVTVVTGFLGAGKTTLVNHILKGNHGKKIAVIENEYGEIGIDDALVMETKEEIFEMNNGCICCTVRGDLIRILNKLINRKGPRLDAIVIETTGLANPAPVIQTFFVDDNIKDALLLDAVLTVVDVKHVMLHLDDKKPDDVVNEAVQQIAFADKVLLNKVDLVSAEEKKRVITRIRAINKMVEVVECEYSRVDLVKLLGIQAFSLDKMLESDPDFLKEAGGQHGHDHHDHHHHHEHAHGAAAADCAPDCKEEHEHHHHDGEHHHHHEVATGSGADAECAADCKKEHEHHHHGAEEHGHDHGHAGHNHLDHKHDDRVSSVGIQMDGSCDMGKLNTWLSKLLQDRGPDLFRSKGILSIAGDDDKTVFQGVHMLLQFSSSKDGSSRPWGPDEKRVNKLVFIGKNLNREELTEGFKSCLVAP